jgi:hypothetical protein
MNDIAVDTVRASRDGHQYHEAWMARRALGLLLSRDGLCAIAVEGLSEDIEEGAAQATIEIADATFFHGMGASFDRASKIVVTQFKYSVARATISMRLSDIKKTIKKFRDSENSFIAKHGEQPTWQKLDYAIVTNRPISSGLADAIASAAEGRLPAAADAIAQYGALVEAIGLSGDQLKQFCARLDLVGSAGALDTIERGNATIIADWSASRDAITRARLGDLRKLVRDKAGHAGQTNHIIERVDVLAALDLAQESDLLPTPQAFPDAGRVVERIQLADFVARLEASGRWLIHASGGIGKTVFVQSLAAQLGGADEVVLFDCFGGGAYRSPLDGRHRPERGLLHIVNELACRGLCDPILPGSGDPSEVIRRSIQRFTQAIEVMRRTRPAARLIVIMDAADNAAMEAENRGQSSFPKDLMEGLTHLPQTEGLIVIATARTERRKLAIGAAQCAEYELGPFTTAEAEAYIRERRPEATATQIEALMRRSDGNPRVIANLIEPDRPLIGIAEIDGKIELDSLIEQRIERAIRIADEKGTQSDSIASFLCALSALPPPVPIEDMATAFGLHKSEIESLAADLSPLLERTRHGLIFRDEPTETLVGTKYGRQLSLLNGVVGRLQDSQGQSIYSARALPGLLFAMDRVRELHDLAFDTRFPPELDSEIAKRAIRLNRLKTALGAAAKFNDFNAAVDLLVELSSITLVDERGQDYLLENPDLVVALGDSESLRRLFEVRTGWPGTRHARLAIAYTTDGDTAEAYGHAVRTDEWLRWARDQNEGRPMGRAINPEVDDYVSIPFYLVAKGRWTDAAGYLGRWNNWYAYKMASRLFELCIAAQAFGKFQPIPEMLSKLARCRKSPPALIAAALSSASTQDARTSKRLLVHLGKMLKRPEELDGDYSHYRENDSYRAALIRCALRASSLGLYVEASAICGVASPQRYYLYSLRDPFHTEDISPWLLSVVAVAVAEGRQLTLWDCLPIELSRLIEGETIRSDDETQEGLLRKKIGEPINPTATTEEKRMQLSAGDRQRAMDYVRERIRPLLKFVRIIADIVKAETTAESDKAIGQLFDLWKSDQLHAREAVHFDRELRRFLDNLYAACSIQVLSALGKIDETTAPQLRERLNACVFINVGLRMTMVKQLAVRPAAHLEAGRFAVEVVTGIEHEDDVTRRSSLFAELARAILPANRTEARTLFRRGLTELDALGSGDYEFTNELLVFSGVVRGGPINSTAALRLAKICELNNYDSHKFPWPLTAKAFSRLWGARYLAQIARWNDRDKPRLEYTLPAALTFLIRDRHLVAEEAVPLIGLTGVLESWDWGWADLLKSLIEVGADISSFEFVLDRYERDHPSASYFRLSDIRAALETSPHIFALLKPRLDRLQEVAARRRKADRNSYGGMSLNDRRAFDRDQQNRESIALAAAASADPLTATGLELLVSELEKANIALDAMRKGFAHLRTRVAYGDRSRHIEAVVSTRNLNLFEKNALLKDTKEAWIADSPSGLELLRNAGVTLIKSHADELLSRDWGFTWEFDKVAALSGESRSELAINLVKSATTQELDAAATTWMNLASILSPTADAAVSSKALERLLDSGAARIADDVGDGPWRSELDPGDKPTNIVAGLVWYCLGSPDAAQRWRAAHVVREYARLGRWKIIERLFKLFDFDDAGAFQDRNLPFFVLHARLWFLLAIARVALDFPQRIFAFVPVLEKVVADDSFPHVAMRDAARRALVACLAATPDSDQLALKAKLTTVNQSPFRKPIKAAVQIAGFDWRRPADAPKTDPGFSFDYDFEKYELSGLGRLFGMPQWGIGDRCIAWIRKWDTEIESMYDFKGRRKHGDSSDYTFGTKESYHSFGTYAAWHALAVVGGELLREKPLVEVRSYEDPWEEWVLRYSITRPDGLWLADGTGNYPFFSRHDLMHDSEKEAIPTADRSLLLSLAGIGTDQTIGEHLTVYGSWNSPDNVSVSVMSALVPEQQAKLAARTLVSSPDYHMWLPTYRSYDDDGRFDRLENAPLEAWISSQSAYVRLDGCDPHGSKSTLERPQPALAVKRRFRLSSKDPWSAAWTRSRNLPAFTSEAWGSCIGEGRSESWEQGMALYVDRNFLRSALVKLDRSLLLLVKLNHYRERSRVADKVGDHGTFTYSWAVAVVDKRLEIELFELAEADRNLVSKMPEHSRCDFRDRWRVLSGS